jgi:hypothetical protein
MVFLACHRQDQIHERALVAGACGVAANPSHFEYSARIVLD